MKKAEITYMIEELTKDLVKNIMKEYEVSLSKALDIVYTLKRLEIFVIQLLDCISKVLTMCMHFLIMS